MISGVAKTALLIAAIRAAETNRSESEGRLFSDPFAQTLAGDEGFAILEKVRAEVGDQQAIPLRTKYLDDRIAHWLTQGIRQMVILIKIARREMTP